MKIKWIILSVIIGLTIIVALLMGSFMSNVERPKYQTIHTEGNIETRQYEAMIIAEVKATGKRKDAIGNGFSILADYIFGNNTAQHNIKMTAPVQQQVNKQIAMTAPVQQRLSTDQSWKISFFMPSEYTIDNLPKPNNSNIVLKKVPPKKFAVIKFSGTNSDNNINKHQQALMAYITTNNINIVGSPVYAFYNPPWTFPPMRRNEVMMEITQN